MIKMNGSMVFGSCERKKTLKSEILRPIFRLSCLQGGSVASLRCKMPIKHLNIIDYKVFLPYIHESVAL